MKKEIKFRAWHKGYNDKQRPQMITSEKASDPLQWLEQCQPVEIMQYTGLKDKNDVEIYEGDIVKQIPTMSYRYGDIGEVKWGESQGGFIVEGGYSKRLDYSELTCDVAIDCEVIGNIYDNPDLLTDKQ